MEIINVIWKISYVLHMISNAGFLGSSLLVYFIIPRTEEGISLIIYKRLSSLFITISGLTGIGLLSIMSMGGMDNLTSNPIGISILIMIGSFSVVLFLFILFLLYKGGDKKIERVFVGIIIVLYLLTYTFRVLLVH